MQSYISLFGRGLLSSLRRRSVLQDARLSRFSPFVSSTVNSNLTRTKNRFLYTIKEVDTSYDLVIIGSGPAAQKCAVDSAKRGKKVAVIDKSQFMGGVCVHTGTIPSKTFREAVLHLTGYKHRGFYGRSHFMSQRKITMDDIIQRVRKVEDRETEIVNHQLKRNGIQLISGTARFLGISDESQQKGKINIAVLLTDDSKKDQGAYRHIDADTLKTVISADKVMIAVGTRPVRPANIHFDSKRVFDSDQLLWHNFEKVPKSVVVIGAGVIGIEYASMFNVLPSTNVTIVDPRDTLLGFADRSISEGLMFSMRQNGARFIMGDTVDKIESLEDRAIVHLASGKRVAGDIILYAMGRSGNTDTLNLDTVGIDADKRGLLQVNSFYQTTNPNIYATGDCIGYPALASTSMEQGRRASCHMWDDVEHMFINSDTKDLEDASEVKSVMSQTGFLGRTSEQLFPFGIYTIPEISMLGKTEEQLTKEKIPYEVGVAPYNETAKGQMLGGADGFLKVIYSPVDLKLLGVHAIGEGATEIVHIGQVILSAGGTMKDLRDTVFNYPTLAEVYNLAAENGLRNLP